jgi:endonuclease-3 related protein
LRDKKSKLPTIYEALFDSFGPQHWWPGDTPLEVIVGAILTQNTAWANVEKAITNLRRNGALTLSGLRLLDGRRLASLIKPSGYYNQKAVKLKAFIAFLDREYGGSLSRMTREKTAALREALLGVHGIGPETADSILLYACGKPVFVVDAYTGRILRRHHIISEDAGYKEIQQLMMSELPRSVKLYNEFHALLVKLGKEYCKKKNPRCGECPLGELRVKS